MCLQLRKLEEMVPQGCVRWITTFSADSLQVSNHSSCDKRAPYVNRCIVMDYVRILYMHYGVFIRTYNSLTKCERLCAWVRDGRCFCCDYFWGLVRENVLRESCHVSESPFILYYFADIVTNFRLAGNYPSAGFHTISPFGVLQPVEEW